MTLNCPPSTHRNVRSKLAGQSKFIEAVGLIYRELASFNCYFCSINMLGASLSVTFY